MTLVSNKQTIKQLNSQLNILEGNRKALNIQCAQIQRNLSENKNQINKIKKYIYDLEIKQSQELTITEHALLRYCERVLGINIEDIKKEILTPELNKLIDTLGSTGTYPYKEYQLKIVDKTIITIINK